MQPNLSDRLLSAKGVGKKYYQMSLRDYEHPKATEIRDWLENESPNHLAVGKGANFIGPNAESYDLAVLYVRGLLLSGYDKIRCVDFNVATEYETVTLLWDQKSPILVTNFWPTSTRVNGKDYARLESVLSHYMDYGIPVNIHHPTDQETFGDLVCPVFEDRVRKYNKNFQF